ncbi:MAG TPA: glycine cleavage system protein GcvH [Candidatus Kapabacteria bacterium]|nr:glycine cleavage system protein GcvH [Candidatus Kapabacteria bacterium]
MNFPANLKYTKDHEWLRVDGANAYVGITDYAQSELGDVVYVDITASGDVKQGASFGTIEAVKTVSDLFLPAGGKVLEVNQKIKNAPETINKDCYNDGWIIKIQLANPAEANGLMDAEAYKKLIGH